MNTKRPSSAELIILHLSLPDSAPWTPAFNYIGTGLLVKLVETRFALAQLQASESAFNGPLNHGLFYFDGGFPDAMAKEILKVLTELHLAAWAKIYQFDKAEGVARCLHPSGGPDIRLQALEEIFSKNKIERAFAYKTLKASSDQSLPGFAE